MTGKQISSLDELITNEIYDAVQHLRRGKVIAYPTETVYGLGCDPANVDAIAELLQIKQRSLSKGFILVGANWEQLQNYVEPIEPRLLARVLASWSGPTTWVFPAKPEVSSWIRGHHRSLAVRVSSHPIVQALCQQFGGPIISTSANLSGEASARDFDTTQLLFGDKVAMVVCGEVGSAKPSTIIDAVTGEVLRK